MDHIYFGQVLKQPFFEEIRRDDRTDLSDSTDVINSVSDLIPDLPFQLVNAGSYSQGNSFYSYRYGFPSFCVNLTLEGRGYTEYHGMSCECGSRDMVFMANDPRNLQRTAGDIWRFRYMNMMGNGCPVFEQLWNHGGLRVITVADTTPYTQIMDKVNWYINRPETSAVLKVNQLLTEFLTRALEEGEAAAEHSAPRPPQWVIDAANHISLRHGEHLVIADLAASFYMDKATFSRTFKRYMGMSPKAYQIFCRMEQAAILLRVSRDSVCHIAFQVGFSSQSLFSQMFRQRFGMTPGEYREKGGTE